MDEVSTVGEGIRYLYPQADLVSKLITHSQDSGIIHLDLAGSSVIVVNSHEIIANDLFEKRSAKYSSRSAY